MRKILVLMVLVLAVALVSTGVARASTSVTHPQVPPSFKDPLNLHAGQPGGPLSAAPNVKRSTVPVSGDICGGAASGNCWWETAVQFWYDMKQGDNEKSNLASVYSEYGGDFQDGWTDDDAWWGIAWQEAYDLYGVASYHTKAENLWTYDTTTGWDSDCGGSTLQHSGGSENDISRAALGELAYMIGNDGSASRAAAWIYQYMQGSSEDAPAAEGIPVGATGSACTGSATAELGGQTESWKVENEESGSGQAGTRAEAVSQYPDNVDFSGQFNLLFKQYIGS